ncbi:MAG TPA: peptidoglycan DD-metalloendopeptidase family protein [Patescibacteria group bacterium]|jgi:septal ring factor EnvC (AmiA/AmiB activator)
MKHTPIKSRSRLLLALFACLTLVGTAAPAGAQGGSVARDQNHLESLDEEILSLAARIPELRKQIAETEELQKDTARKVAAAEHEEAELRPKLEAAVAEYRRSVDALKEAIQIDYEAEDPGVVELAAESGTLSEKFSRASYRAAIGESFERLAEDAEDAEAKLRQQKDRLDGTIGSLEVLQRQQQALELGLEDQKRELAESIDNREDEAQYLRVRITRAKAVRDGLLTASLGGAFTEGERVERGDVVGFEGSTGFSTGCHTHFSVIDGGRWADPALYWRELAKPAGQIFQPFGMTDWAKRGVYGGNVHNGIDFVQGCGNAVRTAADGVIIRDIRNDGSGFGHYVMVRHKGGIITLYAHLI